MRLEELLESYRPLLPIGLLRPRPASHHRVRALALFEMAYPRSKDPSVPRRPTYNVKL